MGQARRNKIAGTTNPKLFTSESLLGPVREAVLGQLKEGKPKPSVIVVDTTTAGTNWMPRVVDDVTGVVGQPAAMSMYGTFDEFAEAEGPGSDPQSLEQVRQRLAAYPNDIVLITLGDHHGVEIDNVEVTATSVDKDERMRQTAMATAELALAERKRRGKGCPAIMVINASDGETVAVLFHETFAEFEHDALMNDDQQAIDEVRGAMAANPGSLIVFMMTDTSKGVFVADMEKAMQAAGAFEAGPRPYFYSEGKHGKRPE